MAAKTDLPENMPYQRETFIFPAPFLGATLLFDTCDIIKGIGGLSM